MLVTCSKCHQEKPVEEFYKKLRSKSGHTSHCAECLRAKTRSAWYKRVEEKKIITFPQYRCDKCHSLVQLDFDPAKDFIRWSYFECPNCVPALTKLKQK